MKVITLIPARNESWILHFCLSNASLFSDQIIILDDNSTDETSFIASQYPKVSVVKFTEKETVVNMSKRRNILLSEARRQGGTHFVFLDADESLSQTFINHSKKTLENMKPGETLCLPWLLVFKENEKIFYDQKKEFYKDFIFCDDKKSCFGNLALSEERTPISTGAKINIKKEDGYVLHFQQLAYTRNQFKQIWYRMNEHIEGHRSPRKINATYDFTKSLHLKNKTEIIDDFSKNHIHLIDPQKGITEALERIKNLFFNHSITYFEPLDIWYLEETLSLFKTATGRDPKPTVFPAWVLFVNTKKNKLKYAIKNSIAKLRK